MSGWKAEFQEQDVNDDDENFGDDDEDDDDDDDDEESSQAKCHQPSLLVTSITSLFKLL